MKRSFKETVSAGGGRQAYSGKAPSTDELIAKYSGMSEDELMRELKSAAGRQKAEGRFDENALKKGMDAIMPMLDDAQKRKLREIVGML
ncbi:MAG: hypothetical protein IIZ56_03280 [Clostridia bacterium]|nr:hypothetical protein [Clostridia bacterium]